MKKQTITDFMQAEEGGYLGYARYVVENRALPSIIDGLKPGARKILHAGLKTLKGEQKFLKLVGATLEHSAYHHGDSSLTGTIVTLSQHHTDNVAPFEIIGAAPELRSPGTASPRYLGVQLSKYIDLYRQDENILDYKIEDGQSIEPKYYLPLIPLSLTKRTSGMGLGYKYDSSISYNPLDLIDACMSRLNNTKTKRLRPYIKGYSGIFEDREDRTWAEAIWELKGDKIIVSELVPSQTFESYENVLDKAKLAGKILDWENKCTEDIVCYEIYGNATELKKLVNSKGVWRLLKLGEWMKRPTLTLLDEDGKVKEFESVQSIIDYFTDFRLNLYKRLKTTKIKDLNNRIGKYNEILKFIELYLDGAIKLDRNTPISETKKILNKHKLPHTVLDIQIRKLTKEEFDKISKQRDILNKELHIVETTAEIDMYKNDLKVLKRTYKNEFPEVNEYK